MKKIIILCVIVSVSAFLIISIFIQRNKPNNSIILPNEVERVKYEVSQYEYFYYEYSHEAFSKTDYYNTDISILQNENFEKYEVEFGKVYDEETVADIATLVLYKLYGTDISNILGPCRLKYNKNAAVWVISSNIPLNVIGGPRYIVILIKDDTGETFYHKVYHEGSDRNEGLEEAIKIGSKH